VKEVNASTNAAVKKMWGEGNCSKYVVIDVL
jgi:hypothetical protein